MEMDPKKLIDTTEKGAEKGGVRQTLDRRLFMQLVVYTGCVDAAPLIAELSQANIEGVLYADVNDAKGVGLMTMSEDPSFFTGELRAVLSTGAFAGLTQRPRYTMLGRTYSLGHEENLEDWLIHRSKRVIRNKAWPWAVYYPLKRTGEFAKLPPREQGGILREHGIIGRAFGQADLGHDIRLASFGLDRNDNDFTIGLIGKDLFPLSVLVQTMRSTVQTSTYIEKMGPFFMGKAIWQGEGA